MITSLHSPHVEAVKALLGSRGNKERREKALFVIEGAQNIREALSSDAKKIKTMYLTDEGRARIPDIDLTGIEVLDVSPQVMVAMTDTVTPQGILALATIDNQEFAPWFEERSEAKLNARPINIAYFWQLQDPGNAGTVIRAADAFGFDAILFSDNSVDIHSPKVVRSSAGSLWHIPIFEEVDWKELRELAERSKSRLLALTAHGDSELATEIAKKVSSTSIWIFGNEARGLPEEITSDAKVARVTIPMSGRAESLNLATAASVVMYAVAEGNK